MGRVQAVCVALLALAAGAHAADRPVATLTATAAKLDSPDEIAHFVVTVSPPQAITVETHSGLLWRTSDNGVYRHEVRCIEGSPVEWFYRLVSTDRYQAGDPDHATILAVCDGDAEPPVENPPKGTPRDEDPDEEPDAGQDEEQDEPDLEACMEAVSVVMANSTWSTRR